MFKQRSLPNDITNIVVNKSTEQPFTGKLNNATQQGTYLCRQCGLALFRSDNKFDSSCGWPSFDAEIVHAVKQQLDADGQRIEILCSRCNAHLGHVFQGEGFTSRNVRHCVNSLSLDFVTDPNVVDTEEAIFAAGCFWGVEYYFKKLPGVIKTEVGYSAGHSNNPTYESICQGNSGHFECIRVLYDPSQIDFTHIAQYFFEIHDPTQADGQGPDLGQQYLSAAFYYNEQQKNILNDLITILNHKGMNIVTRVLPVSVFWRAEHYHQDYYNKTGKIPYCHTYTKRFS